MKNNTIKYDRKSIELTDVYEFAEGEIITLLRPISNSNWHTNLYKTILNNLKIILLFECLWTKLENDGNVASVINCKRANEIYLLK